MNVSASRSARIIADGDIHSLGTRTLRLKQIGIYILPLLVLCLGWAGHNAAQAQSRSPEPPPATCTAKFAYGGNAAVIPADFIGHLVFVPARVNRGEPSLFELNTMAPKSSIDPARAAALGLGRVTTPVLSLSGVDVSFSEFGEEPNPDFAARYGRDYRGTLGNDFLASVVADVDYARETMRLYDPAVYKYSGHGKPIHVTFVDGIPVVKAKMKVGGRSIDADFAVDTALDAPLLIFDKYAQAHQLSLQKSISAASMPLVGADNDAIGRLDRFQIGPYQVEASLVVFAKQNSPTSHDSKLAGAIGGEMLRRFEVVFDYSRGEIYFDPNSEFRSEDFEDMSGLTVIAGGPNLRKFEITEVRPNTPGAEAGLRKGDIIEGVNGDAAADISLVELRKLFHQLGPPYDLVITRNKKTMHAALQLHRLL
jgi:PDZ domain